MGKFFSKPKPPPMPVIIAPPPPVKKAVEPKVVEAKKEVRQELSQEPSIKKKKRAKTKLTGPKGVTRQANVLRPTLGGGAGENTLG